MTDKTHHWLREQVGVAGYDRQKAQLVKRVGGSGRFDRQKPPLVKRAGGSGRARQTKSTTG